MRVCGAKMRNDSGLAQKWRIGETTVDVGQGVLWREENLGGASLGEMFRDGEILMCSAGIFVHVQNVVVGREGGAVACSLFTVGKIEDYDRGSGM